MSKEAMKLALEALESCSGAPHWPALQPVITAVRKALAEQPAQQEPCGWQFFQDGKWHNGMETNGHRSITKAAGVPIRDVYPSPQAQRKPLTDEQMANFLGHRYHTMSQSELEFFRLGEAAHGIKENT